MIVWLGCTESIKVPHPDADLRGRAVVFEFRIAAHHVGHPGALQLSRARPPFARGPRESSDYRVLRLRQWRRLATSPHSQLGFGLDACQGLVTAILLISPLSNRFKRDPLVEHTAGDRAAERGTSSFKLLASPMRSRMQLHDTLRPQ